MDEKLYWQTVRLLSRTQVGLETKLECMYTVNKSKLNYF